MSRALRHPLLLLPLLLLIAFAVWRLRSDGAGPVSRQQLLMGTVVEITATGPDRAQTEAAVAAAFAEMARVEALMGPAPTSDVGRLSQAAATSEVAAETAEVIALGLRLGVASGGAFDMTLGALKALWGIGSEHPQVPPPAAIRAALAGTGAGALTVQGRTVTKGAPAIVVDLGGIAKGYAIDRAAEVLRRHGVASAAVNAGGDIRLLGGRAGAPWRIGIQHPRQAGALLAVLPLEATAIVTSGDYERYFEAAGRRYHHLFDPATGYPADRCQSVTVVAAHAAEADALATAAFVLGPDKGLALLERTPGVEGLLVAADGSRLATSGLQGKIEWR